MFDWSATVPDTKRDDRIVVNAPVRGDLLVEIERHLTEGLGFSIATLNLDHVVKIRHDPVFHRAYGRQTHVTADGRPIVWLSRLAGRSVELVPGSDLVEPVAAIAARLGRPIAFLGSTEEALLAAQGQLEERLPGLEVVARIAPPMGFDPEGASADAAIEEIRASGARLCFLALGAPKQEIFAARAQRLLPGVGFLSIGAGLDFIAGTQVRAPALVRAVAAEWLWRLGSNPRRLAGRYALCLAALPGLTRDALACRRRQT